MVMLNGKRIVLGISGGIAAFKAASLCSALVKAGAHVNVIMTEGATKFITPLTLQTISRHRVITDVFAEDDPSVVSHIDLADAADMVVIAPATANVIAKMAYGLADDMLTTTLLATRAPILVAPAMNVHMYDHPTVQSNMRTLEERGVSFVEPGVGQLACGYVGKGRLAEPDEIFDAIRMKLSMAPLLANQKILITAGGTIERIDPVRYLTNDSSGKMGFAFAQAAQQMGAEVTLIAGNTTATPPSGVKLVKVQTAQQMYEAVIDRMEGMDIIVKAAAVADYRPVKQAEQKMKKNDDVLTLTLEKTTDILQEVGRRKKGQYVIGFAAETEQLEHYAMEKLRKKNCDLIVANDVSAAGIGFGSDDNAVSMFDQNGLVETLPAQSKWSVASKVLTLAARRITNGGAS